MSYAGCKMFVAPSGKAGIILQTEGELGGCVWDFFAAPSSNARSAYDMMLLAIQEGCTRVVTYDHPLLVRFFERFCFQAVTRTASGLVHMIFLDEVFQVRQSAFRAAIALTPVSTARWARDQTTCAFCERALQEPPQATESFGAYHCKQCGFLHVCGTLTPPPPEPSLGPIRLASSS